MATVNSLLILLTTLAPNVVQKPENSSVVLPPAEWNSTELPWNHPSESQSRCSEDEYYTECGPKCPKSCSNYDTDVPCPIEHCMAGCFCRDGMVRRSDWKCIRVEECPDAAPLKKQVGWYPFPDRDCPPNEEYSCFPNCQERCEESWFPCSGEYCIPGCVCISPLVRGPKGDCIPKNECPKALAVTARSSDTDATCGPDEEVSCYSHCQKNCTNYDQDVECPIYCVSGCVCKEPTIRGPDGSCIQPEQCASISKQTWTQERQDFPTPVFQASTSADLGEDLHICPFRQEYTECGGTCGKTCANFNDVAPSCTHCVPGCECKAPRVRSLDGSCILPEQCASKQSWTPKIPIPRLCGQGERFSPCLAHCQKNCSNFDRDFPCPRMCQPGCVCKEPLVRGDDGTCILPEQCPSTDAEYTTDDYTTASPMRQNWRRFTFRMTDAPTERQDFPTPVFLASTSADLGEDMHICPFRQEYTECGGTCGKTCANFNDVAPCTHCVPGCECKAPRVRSLDGSCIRKDQCPEMKIEREPRKLRQDDLCPMKYSEWTFACRMISEFVCVSKKATPFSMCMATCICKTPRVMYNGECILPEDCPPDSYYEPKSVATVKLELPEIRANFRNLPDFGKLPDLPTLQCKENEEFSLCASVCPDNCTNYNQTDRLCRRICIPGCRCMPGYVVGDDGICIRKEDCQQLKRDDCTASEHYDECGSDCEADCTNHNDPWRECENKDCKKGCFCNPGYVRSAEGKCIPISDCPAQSPTADTWWEWD